MENTLIIDCSSGMKIIILKENEKFEFVDNNQKRHTDELLLTVDKLLSDANLKIGDIKNLCVTIGPGSFTGIRVAISICKGLSIGTNAKIFTLSNFDIYKIDTKKSVLVLEGFSDFVYTRVYENGEATDSCEHIIDLVEKIKGEYFNFDINVESEKLKSIFYENNIESNLLVNDISVKFAEKIEKDQYTQINQISPIYLRASQAEIERNMKLKENK